MKENKPGKYGGISKENVKISKQLTTKSLFGKREAHVYHQHILRILLPPLPNLYSTAEIQDAFIALVTNRYQGFQDLQRPADLHTPLPTSPALSRYFSSLVMT